MKKILNGSYDIGFKMELALKNLGLTVKILPLELANKVKQFFEKGKKPMEAKHNRVSSEIT